MALQWKDRRWHVRLYLWAEPIVAKFQDGFSKTADSTTIDTNLCPYMRMILIWLPLTVVANVITWLLVATAAVFAPLYLFGFKNYGITIVGITIVVAFVVGIIYTIVSAVEWNKERRMRKHEAAAEHDPTPTARTAYREWIETMHEGICPGVVIKRTVGSQ